MLVRVRRGGTKGISTSCSTEASSLSLCVCVGVSLSLFQTQIHPCPPPLSATLERAVLAVLALILVTNDCSITGLRRPDRPDSPRGGQLEPASDGLFAGPPGRPLPLGETSVKHQRNQESNVPNQRDEAVTVVNQTTSAEGKEPMRSSADVERYTEWNVNGSVVGKIKGVLFSFPGR